LEVLRFSEPDSSLNFNKRERLLYSLKPRGFLVLYFASYVLGLDPFLDGAVVSKSRSFISRLKRRGDMPNLLAASSAVTKGVVILIAILHQPHSNIPTGLFESSSSICHPNPFVCI
jgi:hypothetical protein